MFKHHEHGRLHANWLQFDVIQQLMTALNSGGMRAAFVGGCVRDALMHARKQSDATHDLSSDIDIAIACPPEQTIVLLQKAHIAYVPHSIQHGTVMAVINKQCFEITSLRKDISTDGRRAVVGFTDDFAIDAKRRDFTINAIYADAHGYIYDPLDGQKDLNQQIVKFIDIAADRIQEDFLRILRFFRFSGRFSKTWDQEGLNACQAYAQHVSDLSNERIWAELIKITEDQSGASTLTHLQQHHILKHALPFIVHSSPIASMPFNAYFSCPSTKRLSRILLLAQDLSHACLQMIKTFPIPKAGKKILKNTVYAQLHRSRHDVSIKELIYFYGSNACFIVKMWEQQNGGLSLTDADMDLLLNWDSPTFPISGSDLIALGIQPGPEFSKQLKLIESWWVSKDFKPSKQQCLDQVQRNKT